MGDGTNGPPPMNNNPPAEQPPSNGERPVTQSPMQGQAPQPVAPRPVTDLAPPRPSGSTHVSGQEPATVRSAPNPPPAKTHPDSQPATPKQLPLEPPFAQSAAPPALPEQRDNAEPIATVPPTLRGKMFGIEIRPGMPLADIKRLATKLGRPKVNAGAEHLVGRWAREIQLLRDEGTKWERVLDAMLAGTDADTFQKEFLSDDGKLTDKGLRKFRTLAADARKASNAVSADDIGDA